MEYSQNNTVELAVTLVQHHMMPHAMFMSDKSPRSVPARTATRSGRLAVAIALLTSAEADSPPELQHLYAEAIEDTGRISSRPRSIVDVRMIIEKLSVEPGSLAGSSDNEPMRYSYNTESTTLIKS